MWHWGPVENEWIVTVPGRATLAAHADVEPGLPACCPFCPLFTSPDDRIKVVRSKYPLVPPSTTTARPEIDNHVVLVYSSSHEERLGDLPPDHVREILDIVGDRTDRLLETPGVESVCVFEAYGDYFGPTVPHPHMQLIALPFSPRALTIDNQDGCMLCKKKPDTLLVVDGACVSTHVPQWARLPFEVTITPKRHLSTLSQATTAELDELAEQLTAVLVAYRRQAGGRTPYVLAVMQAPRADGEAHHLRIEVLPIHKPDGTHKRAGGIEVMYGIYVNPTLPDVAAEMIRREIPAKEEL